MYGKCGRSTRAMESNQTKKYLDERTGLWYDVHWDEQIKCFVWILASNQRILTDSGTQAHSA